MTFKHDKTKKSKRNTLVNPWKLLPMSSALCQVDESCLWKNGAENSHVNKAIFEVASFYCICGLRLCSKYNVNAI